MIQYLNMIYTADNRFFLRPFFFLIIWFVWFVPGNMHICHAQSLFDSDDEDILFEEEAATTLSDDEQAQNPTFPDAFLNDSTFTLGYQFSHGTDEESKIIDNSFYLRLEYETLFAQNLFFKFDGKGELHPKTDHRTNAKNKNLILNGSVREAFFQAGYENFSLKIGNQVNVWGKADTAAITDVVSPRDTSQFIFTRLEDARFGQLIISGNFYTNDTNAFIFISPLPEIDKEPDTNSRYDRPLEGVDLFLIKPDKPEFGDLEYGLKVDKTLSKTDFSIMAGHFYSNAALYNDKGYDENSKPVMEKTYPDYAMAGAALEHAWHSCLFKLELAFKNKFPLQGININNRYVFEKKNILDSAFGIEYNANYKYQMSFEISNRYILSNTSGLLPGTDKNSSAFYTTFTKDFLNQTLEFEYIFYYHIQEQNQFHHFRLTYDLTDNMEIQAGYACFSAEDENNLMWLYRKEDRINFEIKYFF
ncbi:MAG: hypothetical protein K8S13_04615 [Desulfobacula sp.]|uniref:hypothetical protein n=1 Tax=Desulfobacula sp. TaxID=2593537 RepID=UPI0025BA4782|nr:hypothetical protein [Desulfobacula sp.]MCD4719128.1 hypothetical protein [Desulfobacula sp.]